MERERQSEREREGERGKKRDFQSIKVLFTKQFKKKKATRKKHGHNRLLKATTTMCKSFEPANSAITQSTGCTDVFQRRNSQKTTKCK